MSGLSAMCRRVRPCVPDDANQLRLFALTMALHTDEDAYGSRERSVASVMFSAKIRSER